MRKILVIVACIGIILFGVVLGKFSVNPEVADAARISMKKKPAVATTTESAVFVGDVMLARYVEKYMREQGFGYPFVGMKDIRASSTFVIGNFEGTIPERHVPTKPMTFAFSVDTRIAKTLKTYGFTHLFLANNHAYDFGKEAYVHALATIKDGGMFVGGHPGRITRDDIAIITLNSVRVAVVPLHAVVSNPSLYEVESVMREIATSSDVQVAYVHWGEEYAEVHSRAQETLAHALVDRGIDVVIGHHPHVVQDVGLYRGAPIFYSLGNFIFDQYWMESVRTGLALRLTPSKKGVAFELVPVWSERSNPVLMTGVERARFLAALAGKSSPEVAQGIIKGAVEVSDVHLATYPQQ